MGDSRLRGISRGKTLRFVVIEQAGPRALDKVRHRPHGFAMTPGDDYLGTRQSSDGGYRPGSPRCLVTVMGIR